MSPFPDPICYHPRMISEPLTILVTDDWYRGPDLAAALQALAPGCRIVGEEEFKAQPALAREADIVYGRLDMAMFPACPKLRWVHAPFDGMEWAQNGEVRRHRAMLTNSRFHDVSVSEQLFGLLLVLARGMAQSIRLAGQWYRPPIEQVDTLPGKTLCIVGLGTIGRRCAALGHAFGMKVIGVTLHGRPDEAVERVVPVDRLEEALAGAHVVMNLLPLTPRTAGLFGDRQFAALPAGGYFLNAGRGRTVQTDALVRALESGHLKGAGLDVVDPEPLPPEHPLWRMPNAVVVAHYGGASADYRQKANGLFVENLRRFLAGEGLLNVVDKEAGY